jgi:hypothetical protein
MPLQRFATDPVPRPPGLVPPVADLTGVTEVRLHGVGGTTPENLLGDLAPQQVSGDRIAGFYRTTDLPPTAPGLPSRHVEAYSWGGLTSRSGSRVLWLLLLPFALVNVAGWMCTPRTHASPWLFRLHRTVVRWAALTSTLNLVLLTAITTMDLIAYQCGGQAACAGESRALGGLRDAALADYPGRRVLLGALVPLALLVLLAGLTLRSIQRYEAVVPPTRTGLRPPRRIRSSAQPGLGLADPSFWDSRRSAFELGCLHIAAGLAALAGMLAYTVTLTAERAGVPLASAALGRTAGALAAGALATTVLAVAVDERPRFTGHAALASATAAFACAAFFAAAQPAQEQPDGYLPGLPLLTNVTVAAVLGVLLLMLGVAVAGGWRPGYFFVLGPFVTITLAALTLNVVLLGVMNRVVALIAEVSRDPRPRATGTGEVFLYPMIGRLVPYLILPPLVLLLLFAGYQLLAHLWAGTNRRAREEVAAWYREHQPDPPDSTAWPRSTLQPTRPPGGWSGRLCRALHQPGWTARIARARQFARLARSVDLLLTAVAFTAILLVLVLQLRYWLVGRLPWDTGRAFVVASYLATGIPLVIVLLLRTGWRDLESRRRIGVLWDILTFWPRAYHPLAPPSYAERAVPELQRRLWRIHDHGGRVVLVAHSQGSVLAAAALLQPASRPPGDAVALVTFGAPLRTLYGWAFPAYFGDEVLRRLVPARSTGTAVCAWRNFYYRTDYIGADVLAEPPCGVDTELPDPPTHWYVFGQPPPAVRRHSGYWSDPAVWREVDACAARLVTPRPPSQPRYALSPDDVEAERG